MHGDVQQEHEAVQHVARHPGKAVVEGVVAVELAVGVAVEQGALQRQLHAVRDAVQEPEQCRGIS